MARTRTPIRVRRDHLSCSSYFGQADRFFHCQFRLAGSGRQIAQSQVQAYGIDWNAVSNARGTRCHIEARRFRHPLVSRISEWIYCQNVTPGPLPDYVGDVARFALAIDVALLVRRLISINVQVLAHVHSEIEVTIVKNVDVLAGARR